MIRSVLVCSDAAGTGLGLSIARELAEAHGGAITVTSKAIPLLLPMIILTMIIQSVHALLPSQPCRWAGNAVLLGYQRRPAGATLDCSAAV
jgi:signal transduction histidine kinase